MLDGRLVRSVLLFLVLLGPVALAATPSPNRPAAFSMDAQEVTGFGVDPTGQFVGVGVAFDPAKLPSIPVGGATTTHRDVYICNFGPAETPGAGAGCNGYRHPSSVTAAPNAPQAVDATSFAVSGGRAARFAVAGPGSTISLWTNTGSVAEWTQQVQGTNQQAINVSIAADASRIAFLVAPPTGGGSLQIRYANGTLAWDYALSGISGGSARPVAVEYARSGDVVAVGTADTGGVLLFNPTGDAPTATPAGISQTNDVNGLALSADGNHLVAAASNGMFYARLGRTAGKPVLATQVYSNTYGTGAQDAAISQDGSRFAVAVGSDLYFYRTLNTSDLAAPFGDKPHAAGARIADLDYDERGRLLVAVAGNFVHGFGPSKTTPIFSFDATQTAFGALDGPLRGVSVSDDGQRILVAGRTKVMAYSSITALNATLASVTGATTLAPTQTMELRLSVRNTGSLPDNYTFVVDTPSGWAPTSATSLSLDPEQQGEARFNVTAPSGAPFGTYAIKVRVRSAVNEDIAQRRNQPSEFLAGPMFNVTIPRSVVLKVEAPDDRLYLRAGGEQTVGITLRNEGNAEGVVNLTTRQEVTRGASWDVRFSSEQVRVPAGGTAPVSMIITVPRDAGGGDRNIITVRAREGDVEATDQVTAYADAEFGADLRVPNSTIEFRPSTFQTITLTVTNTGNTEDTFNITSALTPATVANDWRVTISTPQVTIDRGQSRSVSVTIKPAIAEARDASLTLSAISQSAPDNKETPIILNLIALDKEEDDKDKDRLLPAPSAALVVLGVLALAVARRRGGSR